MEINGNDIKLLEILGEGAFGIVKRGIYHQHTNNVTDLQQQKYVAVKMLKKSATYDDRKEFHSEIQVMKAVGKHPNIISILGHYTKDLNRMMLITEYCAKGNLLKYLQCEWELRNQRNINFKSQTIRFPSTQQPPPPPPSIEYDDYSKNFYYSNLPITKKFIKRIRPKFFYRTQTSKSPKSPKLLPISLISSSQQQQQQQQQQHTILRLNAYNNNKCSVNNELYDRCQSISISDLVFEPPPTATATLQKPSKLQTPSPQPPVIRSVGEAPPSLSINNNVTPSPSSAVYIIDEHLTYYDLLQFSKQIAIGMEFLAKNKIIHRDLAARNILVTSNNQLKISDFGLSRDIYQNNIYKKSSAGKLPIKWLALESLTRQIYTTQSDVWSYGILLYEIFTFGSSPYPSIDVKYLLRNLLNGYRMERPDISNNYLCTDDIYQLMLSCWKTIPNERPTFTDIVKIVDDFLFNLK